MTYGATPPPPPAAPSFPPPAKKKLSPIVWVLIGCGGLIVIICILFFAGIGFVGYKAKQYADGFEKNPVTTTAKIFAAANPDIEFVSADEDAKKATFRNVKTGETLTFDFDDIKDGRVSIEGPDGKKVDFNATGGEDGKLEVTTDDGKTVIQAGAGAQNHPDWVPVYPGGKIESGYAMNAASGTGGIFNLSTDASVSDLYDFYKSKLQGDGYEVQEQSFSGGGIETKTLVATNSGSNRSVTVAITSQNGKTQAAVQYNTTQ